MNLSGNDKKKITGKKYQPVMSITGLNDQGLKLQKNQIKKVQKIFKNYIYKNNHLTTQPDFLKILTMISYDNENTYDVSSLFLHCTSTKSLLNTTHE